MTAWPKQSAAAMNAYFGNPDADHNGVPDRAWEDANIISLAPPYPMVLAWAPAQAVKSIRCHKLVAPSLGRVLAGILNHYGTLEAVRAARMHLYGGCANFRRMRGGTQLSVHSWGAAIDLDPGGNPLGRAYKPNAGMMPQEVVSIFEAEGWMWGGRWRRPDCQHFQAATV